MFTAEAAAIVLLGQRADFRAAHMRQQSPRLTVHADAAMQVTGGVIRERTVPAGAHVGHAKFVHQVFGEFVGTRCQLPGARQPVRIVCE